MPIYVELARLWQSEGRSVPGLPDPVWESLAASVTSEAQAPPGSTDAGITSTA
ncbi:hypothetical protein [Kitasatospora cathayae]|uniref:Uncharacterized protein n=1 Tax=Kitasatospora cathayae TaxID=3004092 RepID=A0ABY7Q357_9ACTN|nr:hypothetical protein [Kitasatospora sp. HUAS 3-15]WBP86631.1 hypothetical protein O1G21_12780 [Kitasatospora sp. HUAS 3-15]